MENKQATESIKSQSPISIQPRSSFIYGRNMDLCDAIKSYHTTTNHKIELCREMMRNLDELSGIEYEDKRKSIDNQMCGESKPTRLY